MAQTSFGGRLRRNGGYIGVPCEITMDPYWDSCVAAIGGQGTNGATPSADLLGRSISWTGGAAISTAASKFYGSSILVPAGGAMKIANSASYYIGQRDMTCSWWVRFSSLASGSVYMGPEGTNPGSDNPPWGLIWYQSLGGFQLTISSSATPPDVQVVISTPSDFTAGNFSHICVVKSGNNWYFFINGILRYFTSGSYTPWNSGGAITFSASSIDANIQDFAYYVGPSIYTGSFVPPTRDLLTSARRYPAGVYGL